MIRGIQTNSRFSGPPEAESFESSARIEDVLCLAIDGAVLGGGRFSTSAMSTLMNGGASGMTENSGNSDSPADGSAFTKSAVAADDWSSL